MLPWGKSSAPAILFGEFISNLILAFAFVSYIGVGIAKVFCFLGSI